MVDDNEHQYRSGAFTNELGLVGHRGLQARFTSYLQQNKLKLTHQRQTILEEFLCQDDHVSAEELHDRIKVRHPGIGQATVFRTLRLISDAEIAQVVSIDHRTTRYERRPDGTHHDHIQCLGCGTVFEFHDESIEKLQHEIAARYGVHLVRHRMDLFGLCEKCRLEKAQDA